MESPLLQDNKDVESVCDCENTEVSLNKKLFENENVQERLGLKDLDSSFKKSHVCEKMNGYTSHVTLHEPIINGDSSSSKDDDKLKVKKHLTSGAPSQNLCNITSSYSEGNNINESKAESKSLEICDSKQVRSGLDENIEVLTNKLAESSVTSTHCSKSIPFSENVIDGITYVIYESERQMPDIMRLITKDLSEPYSIYTYRYFIHNWPKLCFLVSIIIEVSAKFVNYI